MIQAKQLKVGEYILHNNEPHIVKELHLADTAILILQGLISDNISNLNVPLQQEFEEADIVRRCANVISKSKTAVQIMDAVNFEIFNAKIEPSLLAELVEGDQVTYIKHKDAAKVVEIRKSGRDSILPDMHILQEDL